MSFFSKLFKAKTNETKTSSTQKTTQSKTAAETTTPSVDLTTLQGNELLKALLLHTDADACRQVLNKIEHHQDWLTLASQHPVAAIRFEATQKLTNTDDIQQLFTSSKGRDKNVYRWCKDWLNEQRAQVAEHQAQLARIDYLHSQLNYLIKLGYHPEFSGKLQLIKQEWPELHSLATQETVTTINALLQQCDELLVEFVAEETALKKQAQRLAQAKEAQERALTDSQTLLEVAFSLSATELQQRTEQLSQHWHDAFHQAKAAPETNKIFEQNLQQLLSMHTCLHTQETESAALQEWLTKTPSSHSLKEGQRWLKRLSWPESYPSPNSLSAVHRKLSEINAYVKQQQATQHSQQAAIEIQLKDFAKTLQQGQIKEAQKLNQHISNTLKQLPAHTTQALRQQQQALYAQLQEMRDWADFATLPKKQALVTEMQGLIDSNIAADLLASKIQSLQEEWKALSNSGIHDQELWQQFSQAADQAFEPCKRYFAEQAKLRHAFVEQRQQLIAELQHYEHAMDWATADWPAVQKTLDTARSTFRTLGPVERDVHHKTQQAFNHVCDAIFSHLQHQYTENLTIKEQLIKDAEQLTRADDLKGIVDKVKALQSQWQSVGITPRGPDQKLWKQFRAHCDAVFTRLTEQREERQAEQNEQVTEAEKIVAEALASNSIDAIKQASLHLQSTHLPKHTHLTLSKQLQAVLAEQKHVAKQQALTGLIARLEHLGGTEEQWQQACLLPLSSEFNAQLFEQARLNPHSLETTDNADDLCLLLEIVTEQPSPEAQHTRRMELQVQRLAEGLGKGITREEEIQQLIERWLAVQTTQQHTERFIRSLKHV